MLKKFEVKNFKNFDDWFVFDLADTKSYAFNSDCVENGIAKKSLIYGPNGCGKTNLGHALFDIKTHLTEDKIDAFYSATRSPPRTHSKSESDLLQTTRTLY